MTIARFREVKHRLEEDGLEIIELPNAKNNGRGGILRPQGQVEHHTASVSMARTAALPVVTNGRAGLRNALCNFYVSRPGPTQIYLVAMRTAWHAGVGSWRGITGNVRVIGVEYENNGTGEEWHPDVLYAGERLTYHCKEVFGYPVENICEHFEWTTRKSDRTKGQPFFGNAWRARIAEITPEVDETEEDLMAQFGPPLMVAKSDKGRWYLIQEWPDHVYWYIKTSDALDKLLDRAQREDHPFIVLRESTWKEEWFKGYHKMGVRK